MKRKIIIIGAIVVWIILVGCRSTERAKLRCENVPSVSRENREFIGMPDPSAVYCTRLGYNLKVITDDKGSQHGVCIFPDGSEYK